MIQCLIYTQATKDKVIKPSQWKDDMYISLTWDNDNDFDPEIDALDGADYCHGCGNILACCECD